MLTALPVLPLAFRDSAHGGGDLNALYVDVLAAGQGGTATADVLTPAVERLICNDWLPTPREADGHPLRAIVHWLFSASEHPTAAVGIYLHAASLRLAHS